MICIGNRFAYPDNFGILIYEKLKNIKIDNTQIIEGGVGGMSLIPYFEDNDKILIIDYGITNKKILTNKDIKNIELTEYNHSTALLYLLKSIEKEYTIFVCNEKFDPNNLDTYISEIVELIKELNEKK
ncbi:hypothetical protein [Nautilia lithotrophica]